MIFLCLLYVKMDIDDKEVSEIISKVASKGGTTEEALKFFEKDSFLLRQPLHIVLLELIEVPL